ncbi:acyltransferase [Amycolatopsis sp. NBC_01488]|uniref:acyltransferase family protein n=1 Tax=Amycolatopsis sp. NBC_01488 TaxID=2903563 RepID=UPI002E2876A6|nr:acyltransferase [Amycolatopsis sp. NBC_01488]
MSANIQLVDVKSSNARRGDLPALTGLRFIAALVVFFGHVIFPIDPGNANLAKPFRDLGVTTFLNTIAAPATYMAMTCFFMLSGFVITWSAKPGERLTSFWRRRVVKIFPSHAVTWALCMLLFAGAYTANHGILNLFFLDTWPNELRLWGGANGPAWSLNAEMLFYLLIPLLLIPIRRIPDNRLWRWAGAVVVLYAGALVFTVTVIPDTPTYGGAYSIPQFWFVYFFPPMRLFEFLLGVFVARIVRSGQWPRIPAVVVGVLLAGSYALIFFVPFVFRIALVALVPMALAIGTLASANLRGRRTVLGTRPMMWLGKVSFGFYMTQAAVLLWFRYTVFGDAEFGTVGAILLILALFAVNLLAGWLLHIGVERPAMKHWSRSKKKPVADSAPRTGEPDKLAA